MSNSDMQNGGQPVRRLTEAEKRKRAAARRAAAKRRRRNAILRLIAAIVIIIVIIVVIALIASGNKNRKTATETTEAETMETLETSSETTTEPKKSEVTLLAVGDVLIHTPLLNYAAQGDGTYDFNSIFAEVKGPVSDADIAVCNQETPVDPEGEADGGIDFIFNTPTEIADAEINAGFDIVLQSSNHSYDQGANGMINTAKYWKTRADEALMIGINTSEEERDEIAVYEKNDIKFAVLNYTYGLNGFVLPDDMQYLTTIIDDENKDLIIDDIKRAKEMADFVIVFPHWGEEDLVGDITDFQDEWGKTFTEAGADLIIGAHPHVCEKIDWIEAGGNRALCYYSVGNFASNQQELPEVLGAMARVTIVKEGDNTYIDENKTGVTPIVTQNVNVGDFVNNVVVYELDDYTEEMAEQHDIRNRFDATFSKAGLDELANEIFGDWIMYD